MNRAIEEKIREDWNNFKVEGEGELCFWLRGLSKKMGVTSNEIVFFLNYKLMHGPKDSKFLALTGYKETEDILKNYIISNDKNDFYYIDAILGLACYGEDSTFDLIEERLQSDFKNSFCSKRYVFYWLEMLDFERAKDIIKKYKIKR